MCWERRGEGGSLWWGKYVEDVMPSESRLIWNHTDSSCSLSTSLGSEIDGEIDGEIGVRG
jgi:hypothetical protein